MRYYYKSKDGKSFFSLKSQKLIPNTVEKISEELDENGNVILDENGQPKTYTTQETIYIQDENFIEITEYEYKNSIAKPKAEISKDKQYEKLVEQYIRERYSISQELAILRQKDTKPFEYIEYFDYAEQCKIKAKEKVGVKW